VGGTCARRGSLRIREDLVGGFRRLVVRRGGLLGATAAREQRGRQDEGEGGDAHRRRESFKYDRHMETPSSVHHVGLAVENLDGALDTYERFFGARLEQRSRVEEQGVEAASIRVGESRLELLGALGEDTPVGRFLAKRGPGMHHVAYEVDDIGAALAHLSEAGAELIDETPRRGMFGLEVAFVHPESVHGVLSEVVAVV
jgi:methylmalonyl-CoA/ethylmalonyl-CoA epimerase